MNRTIVSVVRNLTMVVLDASKELEEVVGFTVKDASLC